MSPTSTAQHLLQSMVCCIGSESSDDHCFSSRTSPQVSGRAVKIQPDSGQNYLAGVQPEQGRSESSLSGRELANNVERVPHRIDSRFRNLRQQSLMCISAGWGKGFPADNERVAMEAAFNVKVVTRNRRVEGAYGLICMAHQIDDKNQKYLIKVNPDKNKQQHKEFSMEKGEIDGLELPPHPNIATAYAVLLYNKALQHYIPIQTKNDVPEEERRHCVVVCIVIEYIEGIDLCRALKKQAIEHGAVFATAVGLQIGKAIMHMHNHNVIHRDVKPANIMFQHPSTYKLIDMGMCKKLTPRERTNSFIGTPCYLSPNILNVPSDGYGREVDCWSFAMTLIRLATGKTIECLVEVEEEMASCRRIKNTQGGAQEKRSLIFSYIHQYNARSSEDKYKQLLKMLKPDSRCDPLLRVITGLTERSTENRITLAEAINLLEQQ